MFKSFTIIFILALQNHSAICERNIVNKTCASYPVTIKSLDLDHFVGKWYQIGSYTGSNCSYFDIKTKTERNTYLIVTENGKIGNGWKNFSVEFPQRKNFSNEFGNNSTSLFVVGTDYIRYAVLWLCSDSNNMTMSTQELYILSRQNTTTLKNMTEVNSILNATKILENHINIVEIDHSSKFCNSSPSLKADIMYISILIICLITLLV